ncbi:hypothetical protein FAEPRAM212_03110 [Faecalibacterium prausnitzii M21/2]|uniref:Uncharacterized protein n=1 Tax=Faecalibacterium prausnitzii M21/2 TaxID=411485 RepID=A8SGM9_9FIRM|nr:hypothetical protein FAEPRAM212_03110 [Faecalibacterium prausnitzii M21/2]
MDGFKAIHKIGGICDREYHGLQGASRWFCKIYCAKAVIVGLIYWKLKHLAKNLCAQIGKSAHLCYTQSRIC